MKYVEFKECVIEAAKAKGLTEYELYYTEAEDVSVEALMHEVNKFSTSTEAGACFRCIFDDKMGYASTELFTAEEAVAIVENAMENATVIESADKVFIYEAGDTYVEVEERKTTEPTSAQLIDTVLSLEKKLFELDERVQMGSETGAGYGRVSVALCNSKGLDLAHAYNYSEIVGVAIVKDGDEMYNGFKFKAGDFADFDVDKVAQETVEKATATIGSQSVESGVYDLVFSKEMAATLLSTFFSAFSADAARRGLSLLKGKEGEMVASELVTITDDPFLAESFVKMPFDGEGVATYCKSVVENGKLLTLLHNLTTAHEAGVKSTGNGRKASYASNVNILPYNFFLAPGEAGSKEDIFKAVGKGIYITALNGLHAGANPVTGDFSISSEGFLIEDGVKGRPVKHFTISGNYYELLKKIAMVGSDMELGNPRMGCCFGAPTIMVKEISVAGK